MKERGEFAYLGGDLDISRVDRLDDVVRGLAVDRASDRLGSAEDLLDTVGEVLRERLLRLAHGAGDLDDLVELNVARVLDVLLLLAVANGLLQGTDDERRRRGDDRDGGLTVLDRQLDRDAETLPVASRLGDVLTDLLGRLCRFRNETRARAKWCVSLPVSARSPLNLNPDRVPPPPLSFASLPPLD